MLKHNALNYFLHAWWQGIPQCNLLHRAPSRTRAWGNAVPCKWWNAPLQSDAQCVRVCSEPVWTFTVRMYGSFRIAASACSWKQAGGSNLRHPSWVSIGLYSVLVLQFLLNMCLRSGLKWGLSLCKYIFNYIEKFYSITVVWHVDVQIWTKSCIVNALRLPCEH